MTDERFKPWRRGVCEHNVYWAHADGTGYCYKAARWIDNHNGNVLCGEHKRAREQKETKT